MGNKKCRIYAACGVSQTPICLEGREEKCTREQILMCFEAYEHPDCQTMFD